MHGRSHPLRRIRSRNIRDRALAALRPLLADLADHEECAGVALIGGLADSQRRRFVDVHSDLDLTVFLDLPEAAGYTCPKTFARDWAHRVPAWLPPFQFDLDVDGTPMEVNCHQLVTQIEENPAVVWPRSKQEAYACTCELVHDPSGRVRRLIVAKCPGPRDLEVMATTASQLPWYGWINPRKLVARGFTTNARLLLNRAVELILELLYHANDEYMPHLKWAFETACALPWIPDDLEERIVRILETPARAEAILAAADELERLGGEVLARLVEAQQLPADPFRYVSVHVDRDRQLVATPRDFA
jgi:hypothetical protein